MAQDESIQLFRDSATAFLSSSDQRQRVRQLEAQGGGLDRALWLQIAELGWLSILVSEAEQGLGLGLAEVTAIAEVVGSELLPEPFVDAGVHPLALLAQLPASEFRNELLAQLQQGHRGPNVAKVSDKDLDMPNWGPIFRSLNHDPAIGYLRLRNVAQYVSQIQATR